MTLSEYSPCTQSTRSLNQVKPGPYVPGSIQGTSRPAPPSDRCRWSCRGRPGSRVARSLRHRRRDHRERRRRALEAVEMLSRYRERGPCADLTAHRYLCWLPTGSKWDIGERVMQTAGHLTGYGEGAGFPRNSQDGYKQGFLCQARQGQLRVDGTNA